MTVVMVVVASGGFAAGLLTLWSAWLPAPRRRRRRIGWQAQVPVGAVVSTTVGAVATLALSAWLVGAVAGAAIGWFGWQTWERRRHSHGVEQDRVEALASWCEQLRDLLSAEHGILGTVEATVATCPPPLRAEVARLATRLGRQDAGTAVRAFAREVDDPSGDLVASVVLLAISRSGRTSDLLSELAVTIRDRAAMRLRVEAERSGQRSEARFVIGFAVVVMAGIVIFGRGTAFLDTYDTATGQVMLAVVFAMFAAGIVWMSRLTRWQRPARFLTVGTEGLE